MRVRTRPAYTPEELEHLYARPHDAAEFEDHARRVAASITMGTKLLAKYRRPTVADLSCGNAEIAHMLPAPRKYLGDMAPGYGIVGPIEETIESIPDVHLFILSETLEHLDDPDAVLRQIRPRTRSLLLSTPLTVEGEEDTNPEHYWSWDEQDVLDMLTEAGFTPILYETVDGREVHPESYLWQVWGCR